MAIGFTIAFLFQENEEISVDIFAKSRFMIQKTKKMNCPAKITIRDIVEFPEFKVCVEISRAKLTATKINYWFSQKFAYFHSRLCQIQNIKNEKSANTCAEAGLMIKVRSNVEDPFMSVFLMKIFTNFIYKGR